MPDIVWDKFDLPTYKVLRPTPWKPAFSWVPSAGLAAIEINSYHDNGAEHIQQTKKAIEALETYGDWSGLDMPNVTIMRTHLEIFRKYEWAGEWRAEEVSVRPHYPPAPARMAGLMGVLEGGVRGVNDTLGARLRAGLTSLEVLLNWYWAFETIHPFFDGNGRVGGAVVAAYSHVLEPDKGWLAVNQ